MRGPGFLAQVFECQAAREVDPRSAGRLATAQGECVELSSVRNG
jgi:hypothetical protein